MAPQKTRSDGDGVDPIGAAARRNRQRLELTYRQRALRMFPAICARCGREFSGKRLRELTVHHKDHNHDNNPADGSNWELLCLYCHDNEHTKYMDEELYPESMPADRREPPATYRPFADLADLLKHKK
jgi:hypothetical protein